MLKLTTAIKPRTANNEGNSGITGVDVEVGLGEGGEEGVGVGVELGEGVGVGEGDWEGSAV